MKKIIISVFLIAFISCFAFGAPRVRIKDLASILGARDNQVMGFGLVVGLKNTGDSQATGFTKQAIANLLSKMGVTPQIDFKSRNVAAVMVTANLPPFAKSGQKIDVTVSSMGDALSLSGGTLLQTTLSGPDNEIYATAQGNVVMQQDLLVTDMPNIRKIQSTVGRVPEGALVEREVPVTLVDKGNVTILLDNPDFTTADRMSRAINSSGLFASVADAGTVKVSVANEGDAVQTIAKIENLMIEPDVVAKVIINERTGTIVMGENVRISSVAVSFQGINVSVGPVNLYSEGGSSMQDSSDYATLRSLMNVNVKQSDKTVSYVEQSVRLSDVVKALNAVKAKPYELIAILQAMRKAGALMAEIEVI